jgi:hypothetical protein
LVNLTGRLQEQFKSCQRAEKRLSGGNNLTLMPLKSCGEMVYNVKEVVDIKDLTELLSVLRFAGSAVSPRKCIELGH